MLMPVRVSSDSSGSAGSDTERVQPRGSSRPPNVHVDTMDNMENQLARLETTQQQAPRS